MKRAAIVFIWLTSTLAFAETAPPPPLGWSKTGALGANLSFASSENVVGQTDGQSQVYGLNLKADFNRHSPSDEWRNSFSYLGATTNSPSVPRFVKSSDDLKLATIYLYSVTNSSWGPYANGALEAPIFAGEDVRATPQIYRIGARQVNSSTLHLTDGFKPMTTKESTGLFWKAIQEEKTKLEGRLGLAAMQIAAAGQLSVQGTNTAGELQVNQLSDVNQAGVEAALSLKGKIDDKSGYEASIEAMVPVITNKDSSDTRTALGLTNVDAMAKLTSKITDWASFSYDYKLKIQPQLVDRAQQIHSLVLVINYNLF